MALRKDEAAFVFIDANSITKEGEE